jgi:hypothetical protein
MKEEFAVIECSKPTGVKRKMRKRKLRRGVKLQGALRQNGVNQGLYIFRVIKSRKMRRAMK